MRETRLPSRKVIDFVCLFVDIEEDELRGSSSYRLTSTARGLLCEALIRFSDMKFLDVCSYIGRSYNAVVSITGRVRRTEEWKKLSSEITSKLN